MKNRKKQTAAIVMAAALGVSAMGSPAAIYAQETDKAVVEQGVLEAAKAQAPEITAPQGLGGTAGQPLFEILLPDGWSWTDGTTVISKEKRSYPARITVDDKAYDYSMAEGYNIDGHYVERAVPVKALTGAAMARTAMHAPVLRAGGPDTDVTASFTDAKFRQYLLTNFDDNGDGKLTTSEVESIVDIQIQVRTDITDLTGLHLLTNLGTLKCDGSGITSLDVSGNPKLTYLNCSRTGIQTLNVSSNAELEYLYCSNTGIQALNVQSNGNLLELNCASTGIQALDVSGNAKLTYVGCSRTGIQTLDVSGNTALTHLDCSITGIQALDVSGNDKLTTLSCFSTGIKTLDVSSNAKLTYIDCSVTGIQTLDVSNNALLRELYCSSTGIKTLDVSSNAALTTLFCSDIGIKTLDVSSNPALTILFCSGTGIQVLDVSGNTLLKELYCSNTGIQALDVSGNTLLEKLYCTGTTLAWMNVGSNANLEHINIPMPTISLDITAATFNMEDKFRGIDPQKVTITDNGAINRNTGVVSGYDMNRPITYSYDCGVAKDGQPVLLDVTINLIKSDSTIAVTGNLDTTYTGKPTAIPTVDKTGSTGNVTFTYEAWNGRAWEPLNGVPTNAGKYRVQAHLAGDDFYNEADSSQKEFTISPKNVEHSKDITVSALKNKNDVENLVVKDGGKALAKGTDYDVETKQDGNKVTVTITFKGNYTGTIKKSYTVAAGAGNVQTGDTKPVGLWTALLAFSAGAAVFLKRKKRKEETEE